MMNDAILITAAGTSQRFGEKKEYLPFIPDDKNISVLSQCIYMFAATDLFVFFVITIPKGDREKVIHLLNADKRIMPLISSAACIITEGGATRQESVRIGLEQLAGKMSTNSYVLIHDGARPWVSHETIHAVLNAAKRYGAAVPVIEVTDTQKELDTNGKIIRHLKRNRIAAVQTPQGFLFHNILSAHYCAEESDDTYTDDSEIYAAYCAPVYTCQGMRSNKKITYSEDLLISGHIN